MLPLNLINYKIDFSDKPIGEGLYGIVYPVIVRPRHERNNPLLSIAPSYVDWRNRNATVINKKATPFCAKISKSSLKLFKETGNIAIVLNGFFEPKRECETNKLLRKYKMTTIFYKQCDIYAQLRTRIQGNTFYHHIKNNSFSEPENYALREAYIKFISEFIGKNFKIRDVHAHNVMYDDNTQRFEVIDGQITMGNTPYLAATQNYKAFNQLLGNLFFLSNFFLNRDTRRLFSDLNNLAKTGVPYTEEIDRNIVYRQTDIKLECKL